MIVHGAEGLLFLETGGLHFKMPADFFDSQVQEGPLTIARHFSGGVDEGMRIPEGTPEKNL